MKKHTEKETIFDLAREADGDNTNTPLHTLIAQNLTTKALDTIEQLHTDVELNAQALGNTPLILALKKANFPVVRALLNKPNINVNLQDNSGLTALHWAVIHRADDIIVKLLDLGADTYEENNCSHWGCKDTPEAMLKHTTASRLLYQLNPHEFYFENYIADAACNMILNNLTGQLSLKERHLAGKFSNDFVKRVEKKYNEKHINRVRWGTQISGITGSFAEGHAGIIEAIAYSDIVFHIADICMNRGWVTEDMHVAYNECSTLSSTGQIFKKAFIASYSQFLKQRNHLPVNADILQRLSQGQQDMKVTESTYRM